jgi:ankyrin repeat protein
MTMLSLACKRGDLPMVELLLNKPNIALNTKTHDQETLLHKTILGNKPTMSSIIKLLLSQSDTLQDPSQKINLNAQDYQGNTALHLACEKGYLDIIQLLRETNLIDPSIQNIWGLNAFDIGYLQKNPKVLETLQQCFPQHYTTWHTTLQNRECYFYQLPQEIIKAIIETTPNQIRSWQCAAKKNSQ